MITYYKEGLEATTCFSCPFTAPAMSTHPYTDYLSVVAPAHNSAFAAIDLPDHGICLWTDKDANILHPFFTLRICRSDGTLYEFNQPSPSLQLVDGVTGAVINPLGLNSQSRDRDRYFSTDNPLKNEGPFFLLAKKHTYMLMVHGHIIWRYNGLWVPYDPSQCVQMTPEMVMEDLMKKQQAVVVSSIKLLQGK